MVASVEARPYFVEQNGVDGTHGGEIGRIRNRDGKMVKDSRDN